jgi:hypothetical protein
MTQTIGKEESLIQSRLLEYESKLDVVTRQLYPSEIDIDPGVDRLLKLSYDELLKMHPDDCSIGGYKLKQYSVYIQQKENRYKSIKNWLKSNLDIVIGKYAVNYGNTYTKYEEKKASVIGDNPYAKGLNDLYMEYSGYENELHMISNRINELAKTLSEIRNNKVQK